jgi:hypothetical protein
MEDGAVLGGVDVLAGVHRGGLDVGLADESEKDAEDGLGDEVFREVKESAWCRCPLDDQLCDRDWRGHVCSIHFIMKRRPRADSDTEEYESDHSVSDRASTRTKASTVVYLTSLTSLAHLS